MSRLRCKLEIEALEYELKMRYEVAERLKATIDIMTDALPTDAVLAIRDEARAAQEYHKRPHTVSVAECRAEVMRLKCSLKLASKEYYSAIYNLDKLKAFSLVSTDYQRALLDLHRVLGEELASVGK